jgi:ABC-2 type transport system ATP-binding protein
VNAVAVQNLSHTYLPKRSAKTGRQALRGVSFMVREGEIFGLLGPNGGGKSTLFHILSTYFPPTGGRAEIFGYDLSGDVEAVRRRIGVVFQAPGLDGKLTVRENLKHQGHLYGLQGAFLAERIKAVLARVDLTDRANDFVETLSGGMKRRVELAKGLLHQPKLLILDEPTTGLDPVVRREIWAHLKELQREGKTIALTTHLMDEAELCDRDAILNRGELVALGGPKELKAQIGGDVISVEAEDPGKVASDLERMLGIKSTIVDGVLRIEMDKGHEFIPRLISALPGRIRSVTLSQPSLEDVFIRKTGHRFGTEDALL